MSILSSIFGAPEEIVEPASQAVPSPVEVRHAWRQMVIDAERAEKSLINIFNRLLWMRILVNKRIVSESEWEQACEWYKVHYDKFMLYAIGVHVDDCFEEGSGI